jgi:hypothetical protein
MWRRTINRNRPRGLVCPSRSPCVPGYPPSPVPYSPREFAQRRASIQTSLKDYGGEFALRPRSRECTGALTYERNFSLESSPRHTTSISFISERLLRASPGIPFISAGLAPSVFWGDCNNLWAEAFAFAAAKSSVLKGDSGLARIRGS